MTMTIGSDPEFGLLDEEGEHVHAHDYLPDSTSAEIGLDGNSDIGELRPTHGSTPREHLGNVAKLIHCLDEYVPDDVRVVAGAMVGGNAIGGHIHFGVGSIRRFDVHRAVKALDYYLALPVALIEVPASSRRRRRDTGYGKLSDWRQQDHGFEYRTLSSWLVGWGPALSILSLAYAVVDAVKNGSCPPLPKDVPNPEDFNDCDKAAMRPLLGDIKKGWRALPLYPRFRLEAAYLIHLLYHKKEWLEGEDIRSKWHSGWGEGGRLLTVVGNPKDGGCVEIAKLVQTVTKGRVQVFVYGLSPDRDVDIVVSSEAMALALPSWRYEIMVDRVGRAATPGFDGWVCVGLSPQLREDHSGAAALISDMLRVGGVKK